MKHKPITIPYSSTSLLTFRTFHGWQLQDWGVTVENPEETFKSMDADGSGKHLFFER